MNELIAVGIVVIIGVLCISLGDGPKSKIIPARDLETNFDRLIFEIRDCKDLDDIKKVEKKVDNLRTNKKYKRIESLKGYTGSLYARINCKRFDLN